METQRAYCEIGTSLKI